MPSDGSLLHADSHKGGEIVANIGAIMKYDYSISHPSAATIVFPPRPLLHPTMDKYRDEVVGNYGDAIFSVLK